MSGSNQYTISISHVLAGSQAESLLCRTFVPAEDTAVDNTESRVVTPHPHQHYAQSSATAQLLGAALATATFHLI